MSQAIIYCKGRAEREKWLAHTIKWSIWCWCWAWNFFLNCSTLGSLCSVDKYYNMGTESERAEHGVAENDAENAVAKEQQQQPLDIWLNENECQLRGELTWTSCERARAAEKSWAELAGAWFLWAVAREHVCIAIKWLLIKSIRLGVKFNFNLSCECFFFSFWSFDSLVCRRNGNWKKLKTKSSI